MRDVDPDWTELARKPYGPWIDESFLKYRAAEIRRLEALREAQPPPPASELEIGSNRGCFLEGLCQSRPEVGVYGLELKKGLCELARRRLERAGLSNGHVLNADARLALPVFFGEASLRAIYILFPDPWWKKRHEKRRILDQSLLDLAHWLLLPSGHIVVKTDVLSYMREFAELVEADARYQVVELESVPGFENWQLSTRERHCLESGLPVHALAIRRS
ncbi:MAG: hypothetical protein RBU37_11670 [Myxococcota bacterium]|jgi:tRNA (guanine-N7-)-methyltransferase|nr:hypothetical protein [Myxococcota bacterium]